MKNKITEVLQHDISWFVENTSVKELDECSIEHISKCIQDDLSQGSLNVSYGKNHNLETTGWWRIINWKDIALHLYNATKTKGVFGKNVPGCIQGAQQRFDNEWTY